MLWDISKTVTIERIDPPYEDCEPMKLTAETTITGDKVNEFMRKTFDIYDNDFIQEGDLIEFPIEKGENFVAQVRANPAWLADLVIFYGGRKMWIYDGQYDSQRENREIRNLRDSIVKLYRQNRVGDFICIYERIGETL
jgi:hypothetical protein